MSLNPRDVVIVDGVRSAMQFVYALDAHDVSAGARNAGAHGHQAVGEIHHFRFTRGILDHRLALGQTGCHHQVLGTGYGHHVSEQSCALEASCLGVYIPLFHGHLGTHRRQALDVLVHRSRTDGAAADAFVAAAERELGDFSVYAAKVAWINATYITEDTDWLNARAAAQGTALQVKYASEAVDFAALPDLSVDTRRKLDILRQGIVLPAPRRAGAAGRRQLEAPHLHSGLGRGDLLADRAALQAAHLKLPAFPTTTIGSFPQTSEVRKARAAFTKGTINQAEYDQFLRDETKRTVAWQEEIGLDVLVHGEFERNDMVQYFGEQLSGFAFTQHAWVQSYGSRCVKPPIIYGDVARPHVMTVAWSSYAQSLTGSVPASE